MIFTFHGIYGIMYYPNENTIKPKSLRIRKKDRDAMTEISPKTLDVLKYLSVDGGAPSEDLIEKFGESVKDRVSDLLNLKLISCYSYPNTKIQFYTLTDTGKNYIQDIRILSEQKNKQEFKTFIQWAIPVIISFSALILSFISFSQK